MRARYLVPAIVIALVAASAHATIVANPATITVTQGQTSGIVTLTVTVTPTPPPSARQLRFAGLPAGVTTVPATVSVTTGANTGTGSTTFQYSATTAAATGTYTVTISDPTTASPSAGTTTMSLVVAAPPPVATSVAPTTINQGASAVRFTITGTGFLPGVTLSIAPAGLSASQVAVVSPTQLTFSGSAAANAAPGPRSIVVVNPDAQRSKPVTVNVVVPPTTVSSVSPPALVPGAQSAVLTIRGANFRPGITVSFASNAVTNEGVAVVNANLLRITVSVRTDAMPGPVRFAVGGGAGNPAGGTGLLYIIPRESLAAPLRVTAATITAPRPGTLVSPDEQLFATGLLAVSGSGTITGTWRLDGVPFDRFVVAAAGGLPTEVHTSIPIPTAFVGERRLELAIESPESQARASVTLVRTERHAAGLRLLAPVDRAVIGRSAPIFRWSLVPGAFGYEIEVGRGPGQLPLGFRTSRAEWRPTDRDLARIGTGERRWRIRPVFANEARGQATPSRRFFVLPNQLELALTQPTKDPTTGRWRLRWAGGAPGLLYRVEILPTDAAHTAFSALTRASEYVVPARVAFTAGAYRVRVVALGPDGGTYGRSNVVTAPRGAVEWNSVDLVLAAAGAQVTGQTPAKGSTVATNQPTVSARWTGAVDAASVMLLLDDTDVTPVSTLSADGITYECPLELSPGEHQVVLSLDGSTTSWAFVVAQTGGGETEVAAGAPEGATAVGDEADTRRRDWSVNAEGTVSFSKDDPGSEPNTARLQVSGQADIDDGTFFGKATGDIAYRSILEEPRSTTQESRNWLLEGGAHLGRVRPQAVIGYTAPRFTDGSQLFSVGFARGGAEASVATPAGGASYYRTVKHSLLGSVGGTLSPDQTVSAFAVDAPEVASGVVLRAIGIKVEDGSAADIVGGSGNLYGLYGKVPLTNTLNVVFEGARGDYTADQAGATKKQGYGYLLGVSGASDTWSYAVNLRSTDAEFQTPANQGFTSGGIADRRGADLELRKMLGNASLSLQVHHQRSGDSSDSVGAPARESGGSATFMAPLSSVISLNLTANLTTTSADADAAASLPGADTSARGFSGTLSESVGTLMVSQTFSYQDQRDKLTPTLDQSTTSVGLTANGSVSGNLSVNGNASFTRIDADESVGTTDQTQLSLEPIWSHSALGLSVQPRLAYNRSKNDLSGSDDKTDQYQLVVSWTPPRIGAYLSLQLSGDWSRTRSLGVEDGGYARRVMITLNLHWGASGGAMPQIGAAVEPAPPTPAMPAAFGNGARWRGFQTAMR